MSWIKSKCLLLPSCELKPGQLLMEDNKLRIATSLKNDCLNSQTHGQHLYFTSEEEIKIGDCCIQNGNWICKITCNRDICQKNLKKIIASTDKSLELPEPSADFLQVYVKAYNEGKPIEYALIEQEYIPGGRYVGSPACAKGFGTQLRVKPDNTITIKKVKDSWNKEEVIELFNKLYHTCAIDPSIKKDNFDKWLEQNL